MKDIREYLLEAFSKYSSNNVICTSKKEISYSELYQYVCSFAISVKNRCENNTNGQYFALYIHSPEKEIIAQLAILLLGGVCVPLDKSVPLNYYDLKRFSEIEYIITDDDEINHLCNLMVINMNKVEIDLVQSNDLHFKMSAIADKVVYCIMTSGTTGKPKAVLLKQDAVINQVKAKILVLSMNEKSRLCLSTNLSFVTSIWQILATVFVGGCIVVLNEAERINPLEMFNRADNLGSTIICTVPSVMSVFLSTDTHKRKNQFDNISTLVLTGEPLPSRLAQSIINAYKVRVINAYGQTECTDDTFHFVLEDNFDFNKHLFVPIGYPVSNIDYVIVNSEGVAETDILTGELCITGTCLSLGYLDDDEMTNKKFKTINGDDDRTFYFTGDLVSQLDNGMLVCHGRVDNQIKINGCRIEPEAIEAHCMNYSGVEDALAIRVKNLNSEYIHLIYKENDDEPVDTLDLRNYLTQNLPSYMIPAIITKTKSIQYSSNGKKIRKIEELLQRKKEDRSSISALESKEISKDVLYGLVHTVFRDVIRRELNMNLPLDMRLDSLVNSLEFVYLVVELEQILGIEFDLDKFAVSAFSTLNDFLEYVLAENKRTD